MNLEAVRRLLERQCRQWGAQAVLARRMDVAPQFISAVLAGRRQPSARLLEALGLEEVRSYRPLQPSRKPVRNGKDVATVARTRSGGHNHAQPTRAKLTVD